MNKINKYNLKKPYLLSASNKYHLFNVGSYVGVVIEDDNISEEEFKKRVVKNINFFKELTEKSNDLEFKISKNINQLI